MWPPRDAQPPLRWKVKIIFSDAFLDLWEKPLDAFLLLRRKAKRLVHLDSEEVVLDARNLLEGEFVSVGATIEISYHTIKIEERISSFEPFGLFRKRR